MQRALLLFWLFFGLWGAQLQAQFDGGTKIYAEGILGSILPIYPGFPENTGQKAIAVTALFGVNQDWNTHFGRPWIGATVSYHNLGNDAVLGNMLGINYSMQFDYRLSDRWRFTPGFSMGFGFFNQPFHVQDNPENIATGGWVNFLVAVEAKLEYRPTKNLMLFAGGGFHHASNAHTTLPNVGLNMPNVRIGAGYYVQRPERDQKPLMDTLSKRWQFGLRLGLGYNELGETTSPSNGPNYLIYSVAPYLETRLNRASRIRFGLEAYYNRGYRDFLVLREDDAGFSDVLVLSPFTGVEYLYGRLGMYIQVGVNAYRPAHKTWIEESGEFTTVAKIKTRVSGRFGVHWHLRQPYRSLKWNSYLGVHIKSNLLQADYMDVTWGFIL